MSISGRKVEADTCESSDMELQVVDCTANTAGRAVVWVREPAFLQRSTSLNVLLEENR